MPAADPQHATAAKATAFRTAIDYSGYAARVAMAQAALLEDSTFDPAGPLTREGMLAFLDRATPGNDW